MIAVKEKIDVIPYIEKLKGMTHLGNPSDGYHFVNNDGLAVELEFGKMLMDNINNIKPRKILEIGTGHGYSTSWILLGTILAGRGMITTIDHINRTPKIWESIGIPLRPFHVSEICSDFVDYNPFGKYDFIFHDSEHKFELISRDLERLIPHLSKHGQIWIHDANGAVGDLLKEYFEKKEVWDYQQISESYGMGMARRKWN